VIAILPNGKPEFDAMVPNMLQTALPPLLIGLVVVLVLSASLSTLSALVLTSSTTLAHDLLRPASKGKMDDKKEFITMRVLILFFLLVSVVIAMNKNAAITTLTEESTEKTQVINTQDKQLHTAWFVFGTKDELKEQQILVDGKVLQSSFNKEYFTKIDIRVDKEIKLYSSSAKILTSHPSSAYTLQRDANKQYVLRITDPILFWSTSKYLVVLVK
jgi:hypothetical protein